MPRHDAQPAAMRHEVVRQRSKLPAVPHRRQGFVAAATRTRMPAQADRAQIANNQRAEDWQNTAWDWYDIVGEFRYAVGWVGNLLSKARLYIEKDGAETTDYDDEVLEQIYGGRANHSEMLRQLGIHFTVAGEAYLIDAETADGGDEWFVVPAIDLKSQGDGSTWTIGDKVEFDDPLVIRMWRPHPRRISRADAPARACLDTIGEINGITQHIAAQVDSRLAGAGLLLMPDDVKVGKVPTRTEGATVNEDLDGSSNVADDVIDTLIAAMTAALQNRSDPSALVPIVFTMPADAIEKVRHLTFSTPLDEHAIEQRTDAIRRLALGMDMPPEVLTGTSDMNHWSSWQVEEAAIKAHTEPLLAVICASLTQALVRPLLLAAGVAEEDLGHYQLKADTANLKLRPNRSKESEELYDRGLLSGVAVRRENGFDETDAPDEKAVARQILWKLANGSATPEMVAAAIKALGGGDFTAIAAESAAEGTEGAPTPTGFRDKPTRELPDQAGQGGDENPEAIAAAAHVMVRRALEVSSNRLRTKMGGRKLEGVAKQDYYRHVTVAPDEVDALLGEDPWDLCEDLAAPYGANPAQLRASLGAYTRRLIESREPHSFATLKSYLSAARS